MTDLTIQEEHRQSFTTYSPFSSNHRTQITEWISGGAEGEFPLESIAVQIQPPFKTLSEYYFFLVESSLQDFFQSLDAMFPDFKLRYRYDGFELSFYLTSS
jgi:hypothetical protein